MGKHSNLGPIDPQYGMYRAHGIIEECQKAIDWSNGLVEQWLTVNMFSNAPNAIGKAKAIVDNIGSHALTKSHNSHCI